VEVEAGVPQGAVISPLLSNIYLHPFDQEMTKAGYALVRYGDDCLVLSPTRDAATQALKTATTILQQVRLRLNPEAHLRS
jgi:RNA-directed DNA polymerase